MVVIMKNAPETNLASETTADPSAETLVTASRFPRAATDYIDALLKIQRMRFDRENALAARFGPAATGRIPTATDAIQDDRHSVLREKLNLPDSTEIQASSDNFNGTGWSDLGHRRDGTAFRWMGRLGTLLLPVNLERGASLTIEGCGFSRKKFLKQMTVWIEGQPVTGAIKRRGFNRWIFTGEIRPAPWRPYSILQIQSSGMARLAVGVDSYVSLAVNKVTVKPD